MGKPVRILICDDQAIIHETLGVYLASEGYSYSSAYDGEQAVFMAEKDSPDLILMDLMMPKLSGMEACRQIRAFSNVPIIMLTAKGEEIDRVLGLEFGADDYIVKPFSAREVVARIKAVLRRTGTVTEDESETIRNGDFEISLSRYEVKIQGKPVAFTPKEVEILYLLASHPGRVFDREQILSKIWGYDYFGDTRAVDTQIKRIRQKIPEGLSSGIRTVYGVGYKFGAGE